MASWNRWTLDPAEDGEWAMQLRTPGGEPVWEKSRFDDIYSAVSSTKGLLLVTLVGDRSLVEDVLDATGSSYVANCYEPNTGDVLMTPLDVVASVAMGIEVRVLGFVEPRIPSEWTGTEQDARAIAELILGGSEQEEQ